MYMYTFTNIYIYIYIHLPSASPATGPSQGVRYFASWNLEVLGALGGCQDAARMLPG